MKTEKHPAYNFAMKKMVQKTKKRKNKKVRGKIQSNNSWVTMIIKQRNMRFDGVEYLETYVGNFPDTDSSLKDGLGVKNMTGEYEDKIHSYANWLHDKFNTQDIIDEIV